LQQAPRLKNRGVFCAGFNVARFFCVPPLEKIGGAVYTGSGFPDKTIVPPELTELPGLRVKIDKVVLAPHLEAPPERPYPFVYYITIINDSDEPVTIKGRKWVVTESNGLRSVVEGDGVVGKFPRLEPGHQFHYNSYHVVATDSVAEGAYIGVRDDGTPVIARIPRFDMQVPV
jgi:ApaG protein